MRGSWKREEESLERRVKSNEKEGNDVF